MKKIHLTIVIIISTLFIKCSKDSDSENLNSRGQVLCKMCDNFTNSEAVLEVCNNDNDTVTRTVFLSGISVYSDVVEIDSSDDFSELLCESFNEIEF